MAPLADSQRGSAEQSALIIVLGPIAVVAISLVIWLICACGDKHKDQQEEQPPPPPTSGEPNAPAEPSKNEVAAGAAVSQGGKAAAGASAKATTPKSSGSQKRDAPGDMTQGPKGGADKKRVAVLSTGAVAGNNPAYQTIMDDTQFKATQKGSPKGGLDKVAGTNPAYQTIMNDQNFEPSQKAKSTVKGAAVAEGKATITLAANTAMAGPSTERQAQSTTSSTIDDVKHNRPRRLNVSHVTAMQTAKTVSPTAKK